MSKFKPHSKLPFDTDILMHEDHDDSMFIHDSEKNEIATIYYASDAEYLCEAANNYQEAVELLQFANRELSEFYHKTESDTLSNIKEFLKKKL